MHQQFSSECVHFHSNYDTIDQVLKSVHLRNLYLNKN